MKPLDIVKEKFLEIYPVEENVRERRLAHAGYKCENCGGVQLLQQHHVIEKKNRRKFFERVFTTRILCSDCHIGSKKYEVIPRCRKELEEVLLGDFTVEEVLLITGHAGLVL